MNLSQPFILRPVMTTFLMIAMMIGGWMAFAYLPVSDVPTIEVPKINVSVSYAGAAPETMLTQVTTPLEKELTHVKGVEEMVSTTSTGASQISLTFDLSKDMNEAIRDVQDALNRAERTLPSDIDARPSYSRQADGEAPIMYMLFTSNNDDIGELRSYTESYILPRLSRIEGLAQVMVMGDTTSLWLRVNPEKMAARKIGFNQIVDTVKKLTAQTPLGSIQTTNRVISLELSTQVKHAREIENAYISGTSVQLKELAEVSTKAANQQEFYFSTPQERTKTLILAIQKISDGNTVAVAKAVRQEIEALQKSMPATMKLNIWFDKSIWIEESITDVQYSLLFAFILVVLVIYLSLGRVSDALIPTLALPLSLVGTFIAMYLLEYSLDLLSLLALTLSVGFVVDDAIVVLENIVRNQEQGASPLQASLQGAKQICFTILSMTFSLVAVFIPLLFMEGVNGRLFREFSVTLAVSIIISGFVSLSLTPMLCSRFLSQKHTETKLQSTINAMNAICVAVYGRCLRFCFRHTKKVLAVALACVAATIPLFSLLSVNLLPAEDRGFIFVFGGIPSGSSAEQKKNYQDAMQKIIQKDSNIESFVEFSMGSNLGFMIRLLAPEKRLPQTTVMAEFQATFDQIPGIQTFVQGYQLIQLEFDLGAGGQYKYHLQGTEFTEVEGSAEELLKALKSDPAVASASLTQKNDTPKLAITVNEEYAHRIGLKKNQVQELLQYAYGQGSVGKVQNGNTQRNIYMELGDGYRDHLHSLNKLFLTSDDKSLIPLNALVAWKEVIGAPKLTRRDQLPSTSIRFSLAPSTAPQQGIQRIENIAREVLPENVSGSMGGSAKAVSSAMNHTLLLLLAAAIVMYIVLGILYESFIHPLTILSSLPFACLGGILTLLLFREPISIFSAVGFLLLIGIVKKNGIMMIDYALEAEKGGASPQEAIYQGCLVRFRPIMMTTVAAVMGALPIAIGFGDGAEMRRGLGLVIVGGLLFSQGLTLFVTPLLFLYFDKLGKWLETLNLRSSTFNAHPHEISRETE